MGMVKSSVGGSDRGDEDALPDESQQAVQPKITLLLTGNWQPPSPTRVARPSKVSAPAMIPLEDCC